MARLLERFSAKDANNAPYMVRGDDDTVSPQRIRSFLVARTAATALMFTSPVGIRRILECKSHPIVAQEVAFMP